MWAVVEIRILRGIRQALDPSVNHTSLVPLITLEVEKAGVSTANPVADWVRNSPQGVRVQKDDSRVLTSREARSDF